MTKLMKMFIDGDIYNNGILPMTMNDYNITTDDIDINEVHDFVSGLVGKSVKEDDVAFAIWLYLTDKY